jgi:uncharacterized protein YbjQ (UPF0145 family)
MSTTSTIEGETISKHLGLVKGNTIRAKHIGKDILASLRTIVGGEIKEYTEMLNDSRKQAIERMEDEAKKLDADAVVGVRFTTSAVLGGAAELLAYGTAVKLK